jgi:hypothetical protein
MTSFCGTLARSRVGHAPAVKVYKQSAAFRKGRGGGWLQAAPTDLYLLARLFDLPLAAQYSGPTTHSGGFAARFCSLRAWLLLPHKAPSCSAGAENTRATMPI